MNVSLKVVQIYTNKSSSGRYFYNLVFIKKSNGKKYSITLPNLFINTKTNTVLLSDDFNHKVYDSEAKTTLSDKQAKSFVKSLLKEGDFIDITLVESSNNSGQDEGDDVPF